MLERRPFGQTDMQVSPLGFGGAEIGFEAASPDTVRDLLAQAIDLGLNVIDSANFYLDSEEKIGQAIAGRREQVYLFTKCGNPSTQNPQDWGKDRLLKDIQNSLRMLRTDRLDLVQLHSCSAEILRQGEVVEALQEAKARGYTRYIGYSGDREHAVEAIAMNVFDSLQTSCNIADQQAITLTIPEAARKKMGVIIKRPIANAAWRYTEAPANAYHLPYWKRLQELQFPFLKQADVAEIALRFVLSIPGVSTAIVGTTKPSRWKENAEVAARGNLSLSQLNDIQERFRQCDNGWVGQT